MAEHNAGAPRLWDKLLEVYDTYLSYSFTAEPPDRPLADHWRVKSERAALVFLGMPMLPVVLYRLRNYLVRARIPLIPYVCELLSNTVWGVSIGRQVEIGPGLIIPHGQVVIDGVVKIGHGCSLNPWVTIGLSASRRWGFDGRGPVIGDGVFIGTGAKVLGPISIGDNVRIGANAVVLDDVPEGATVVGMPARVVRTAPPDWSPVRGTKSDGNHRQGRSQE